MRASMSGGTGKGVFLLAFLGSLLGGCAALSDRVEDPLKPKGRRLLVETAQRALEKNKVGQSANWSNPETGALGTVTPTRTFRGLGGKNCRDYQATLTLKGDTTFAYDTACREPDGSWKSVYYPGKAGAHVFQWPYDDDYGYDYPRLYAYPYYYPPYYPYRHPYRYRFGFGFGYYR